MTLEDYKTLCCNAETVRHGRADIRCAKCGKDVTLEMVLIYEASEDAEDDNEK